jgi:hypothetical protein
VPDRPVYRPVRPDLYRAAGTQPGGAGSAPGHGIRGRHAPEHKTGLPVASPVLYRNPSLVANQVRNRWQYRAAGMEPAAPAPTPGGPVLAPDLNRTPHQNTILVRIR